MDATQFSFWKSQGPWAVLFVLLLLTVGRFAWKMYEANQKREDEHRAESKSREEKLMAHNEGYQKALGDLNAGQQRLTDAVTVMRQDINRIERHIGIND